jgi:pectinesterase
MKRIAFLALFLFSFILGNAQGIQYKIVVAKDGSGDFTTIQEAIDATKSFPDKRIIIHIKNGIYHEKIRVPSWNPMLSLIGEDVNKTIITFDDHFKKINRGRNSTFFTATLLVEADDFHAENLTIENSAGPVGQAEAMHVEGNRCVFKNCRILGNQDTLYVSGENSNQLYINCTVEGTTDFIFGSATAVFKSCNIISKSNSFITAASTTKGKKFGLVFLDCNLTASEGVDKVYLGRPWRTYAKTVFIRCDLGNHIIPEGWQDWGNQEAHTNSFYAEYENKGDGADTSNRASWAHILTKQESIKYTIPKILGEWASKNN